jgi:FtsP/CotA-like multicopper oxidase with cupredoxin domain
VTSILINGRGQYFDPRNNDSSTTPLERLIVHELNTQYRIRLINGGSAFSLVFSIDEHPLQVVSSDGVPFDQPILVDQIVVGLGERYDLVVNVTGASNRTSCKL